MPHKSIFDWTRNKNIPGKSISSPAIKRSRILVLMTTVLGTQEQKKWRSRGTDPNVEFFYTTEADGSGCDGTKRLLGRADAERLISLASSKLATEGRMRLVWTQSH
jgi:hypothetical protein